ncbi:MAG: putative dual-specificity RNA methyltransferase RlmN [Acidimicrobiales bacterium]|nr:MAG: putative dual-specificity RNA methyltransferase RlmN [Acidimicrobiales bacterium]
MPGPYAVDREEIASLLVDQPRWRVDQVWRGLYERMATFPEMTDLPKGLRERLEAALPPALSEVVVVDGDRGSTRKWLWELQDGERIETVLMVYPRRSTVCISSQAGCGMGCVFCATGQAGFRRNLDAGEMVEQVARAGRFSPRGRVSNVVFMGMGEPLANFDHVWTAVRRIHEHMKISARSITVSTVGVVPGIRALTEAALPVTLAVSLHAANDSLRDQLVPLNRTWPLNALIDAVADDMRTRRRRVTFEWAMMSGVNDSHRDAAELVDLLSALPKRPHVNLIPLNPTPGWSTPASPPERIEAFAQSLRRAGVNATIRRNRGVHIDAACGQLRAASGIRPRRRR